ncbi:MAG: alkaline phosphatase family protein [Anaerolineales bacterium]
MKFTRRRIFQAISILVVQAITLILLQSFLDGLQIETFWSAIGAALAIMLAQVIFGLIFIEFLAHLPVILYPILTFFISGSAVLIIGNLVSGITIEDIGTGIWIVLTMTLVNSALGALLAIDEDAAFDRLVTGRMVKKFGKPTETDIPGFIFLEVDGLGEEILRKAVQDGYMPTLQRWLDEGTHHLVGWETDFTSQTGAMQTGILLGNNNEVPAYRWWDRANQRIIMSGDPRDALKLEKNLTTGKGLLSEGGASRGNMFSGDATESILTMSTVLNRERARGPGFYFYLFSPYVVVRLIAHFVKEVVTEWIERWQQKRRKDKYIVSARNPFYAFFRSFMGPLMQDLATYTIIGDVLRGVPAMYGLFAGYDDLSHFAGMRSPEAFKVLHETDRYFARIQQATAYAPRPYHIVVLSDHGQSLGPTFESAYGVNLENLVDALIAGEGDVYTAQGTDETWDKLQVLLTESIQEDTRTAKVLRRMFRSRTKDDIVQVASESESDEVARGKKVVVVGSGCAGLIYFTGIGERMTYEQIQEAYPELLLGLVKHPGIGFALVDSKENGPMVLGKGGIHFLSDGKVEGEDPLIPFGPNAARHLKRENEFSSCPDILVNTTYDPETEELPGFENQVSHHGGIGGPQCHPFLLHPASLPVGEEPIVTAVGLHKVLRSWREQV